MGLRSSTTATLDFDGVELEHDRLIGAEGSGLAIALRAARLRSPRNRRGAQGPSTWPPSCDMAK